MKKLQLFLFAAICAGSMAAQTNTLKDPNKTDYVVTIKTDFGEMVILLYDKTPRHKQNFIKLAKEGYYNGTTFHRIIKDFMIQGGDPNSKDDNPNNDGMGGPNYTIPAEFVPSLKHVKGSVAAARMGDAVNPKKESNGSQFYIVHNANGTPMLDGSYTVFGKVVKGLEVIDLIASQPKDARDRPLKDIKMTVTVTEMKVNAIIKKYQCTDFYSN
ncbi:MAG: peptidylprolyl isomerase [Cytophagaceae bacterium]|nr:peptidylprolyl isomerase [Cytophagaceae bacterium]MDW8456385.1 peptidylprolyl isomerase [Cytophagaceae bacterium]